MAGRCLLLHVCIREGVGRNGRSLAEGSETITRHKSHLSRPFIMYIRSGHMHIYPLSESYTRYLELTIEYNLAVVDAPIKQFTLRLIFQLAFLK